MHCLKYNIELIMVNIFLILADKTITMATRKKIMERTGSGGKTNHGGIVLPPRTP
jgi:hypothetical protein